jgi:hypothetical protein
MVRQVPLPVPLKQPTACAVWPVQNKPVGSVRVTVLVVSGERSIASTPAGVPSTPSVGQSRVSPTEFVVVQG